MASDNVIVLDYGSQDIRAGFAFNFPTEEEPRVVTPCAVDVDDAPAGPSTGKQRSQALPDGRAHPVQRGRVTNWDQFEALLYYVLYDLLGWELGLEGNILVTEPLLVGRPDREMLTQLMFEVFNVNGLLVQDQAVLSLYAVGKTNGLVVDIGHDKTDVSTVTEGNVNHNTIRRLDYGGQNLDQYLTQLLAQQGVRLGSPAAAQALKELCAACCESEAAATAAAASAAPQTYTLPDGQDITVTAEGMQLGEAMFRPGSLLGVAGPNLVEAACDGVACQGEAVLRKLSYENMLVCGGGSAMPGISARFLQEMRAAPPMSANPQLCQVPEYMPQPHTSKNAAWVGGAVLAKVVLQQNQFMSKGEYDELGPAAINRR